MLRGPLDAQVAGDRIIFHQQQSVSLSVKTLENGNAKPSAHCAEVAAADQKLFTSCLDRTK